jgi:hypothetical protein
MRKNFAYAGLALFCLIFTVNGFGQSVNASVGGSVADSTGALIPGVTVTATNTGTGIANMAITNESGVYNFPSLQPGAYKVSAELPGFQTQTFTDVQLGGAQQVRLNFTLQVAAAAGTNVEVTVAADTVLATTSNSIGTVLPEYKIRDLPSLTGNVFNLVANMPGVQRNDTGTFGFMAGGRLGDVNTTRDGINVNDGRYENGAWSTVYTSPDMVEEVKVIVAPVDAETSRGNGQVSMVTRSGTNQYRGSVSWSNHNSALDANSWFNNTNGVGKSFDNRNLYSARVSGPIIKNKTFFFALFSGQRDVKKTQAAGLTWTDMAKAGIIRYWPGVDNQNASGNNPGVDLNGNPIAPTGATGPLSAVGLFGSCNYKGAPVPNCKVYNDPLRPAVSNVPFIQETLKRMPSPNQFTSNGNLTGDGLNTAIVRFVRRQDGLDLTNGNGDEVNRDQYNARIDHNFNSKHKISLIGTQEKTWGTATQAGLRSWPDGFDGLAVKRPVVYSIQVSSTLSSSMLNQLRMGKSGSNNWQWGSGDRGDEVGAEARKLLYYANGIPIGQFTWATNITSFVNKGGFGRWREGINPRYSIGDDLSWTVRKHAFKGGFEWRRTTSNGFNDPNYTPIGVFGAGNNGALLDSSPANGGFTGLQPNVATTAKNFLYDLTGQIQRVNESFGILSAKDTKLQGYPVIPNNRHWNYQSEMSAYFKDDWKFRPDLTVNIGLHWEYYGQPYEHDGLAARVVGDESTFLNLQCAGTPGVVGSNLLANGSPNCTNLATVQFVGKNSTNPNIGVNLRGNDYKSFAPSIGIAWNVPWFGKGKTVLRTGYGIAYSGALRNFINVDSSINSVPGVTLSQNGSGLDWNPPTATAGVPSSLTTLSNLSLPIPFPTGTPTTSPFPITTTTRNLQLTTYNYTNPYTQNWNLEIQREVAKNTTVEIRYVGTKGTGLLSSVNLNALNYYRKDTAAALFAAFDAARAGAESPLLNQLFNGVGITGGCGVVGATCTGAQTLRMGSSTRADLANGSYGSLLNRINTTLQYSGGPTDAGSILRRNGFPENYLTPDPQYSTINIQGNNQNSTYHSLHMQVTRRLSNGFTATTTYIWSKAIGDVGTSPDPNDRHLTKTLQAVDRKHQITSNGTYELPFGTGHFLLGNAPGWMQNIVGKWQLGGIMSFGTGVPLAFSTGTATLQTITNQAARPIAVGDLPSGKVTKVNNGITFFDGYKVVTDPGLSQASPLCAASTTANPTCNSLSTGYNLTAIQDPSGRYIMVNPGPGNPGGLPVVRGPKSMNFDMNLVKRIQITESKQFELRIDAVNILNKANFAAPEDNINSANFGRITALRTELVGNGMRSFIINTRLNF